MPTPVKLITWGTEYSEMLAEMGILEGEQSRFIRLLIDEAYRRFRAGNPVSVGETPKERYENLVSMRTILRQAEKRIAELEAENNRLAELLHNELSSVEVATDLGNKRWVALNDIYENGEKHNTNWCKRIAQEGLGIK